ncbi:MAG: hypothetical protein E7556_06145 [Ruminococcaceae bacterium]|nr:hypothetical protein [Oscillospiraceae bacterium]
MKTKRLLATVLAVVMLLSVFSVISLAAGPYTFTLTQGPTKTEYYDYEKFSPAGISVTITDASGAYVESISYSSSSTRFQFSIDLSKKLTVDVTEVEIILDGVVVATVPVTVNHKYEENTSLGSTKHGTKCFGCGYVIPDSMEEHTYDDTAWTPNDDSSFLRDNTESNFCLECNHEIKREIDGTAGYDIEFEEYQFLRDLMVYIDLLLDAIFGAIKR